jgi:site-specific DNA-methyltransferase (adenine-specific)
MPGMPIQNLWDDLPVLNNRSREVLGYPTQKPLALLERIISASSNPGDVVLDPFCGCGTAIEAAQALNRKWIGIDITALALDVVERRLLRTFRTLRREADYFVEGIPLDLDGAKRLFDQDAHEFQLWALTLVDGQPREGGKRGPDGGVDGLIYFQDTADTIGHAIVSVKGGFNRSVKDVRDLIGTMNNQRAKMGVLVTLHEPTPQMERTAREAESIEAGGRVRARVQIRTIQQLFQHNKPDLPPIFDVISAAAAARRMRRSPSRPPTPEELRREPELPPMPIAGGRGTHRQEPLPLEEPLLSTPQPSQRRRRSRS